MPVGDWVPVVTAAIGATAALGGSALNPTFAAKMERGQWRRNRNVDNLENLFYAVTTARSDVTSWLATYERFGSQPPEDADALRQHHTNLKDATNAVQLHSTKELRENAKHFSLEFSRFVAFVRVYSIQLTDEVDEVRTTERLDGLSVRAKERQAEADTILKSIREELNLKD